jgi:acyl dehydratase
MNTATGARRIPATVVGTRVGPREHDIDARWLMAYAAALGETAPEYLDTTRPGGVLAHPLFPVCYEWPLALDARVAALPEEIAVLSVHATHRLVLHRPPRAGDRLATTATFTTMEPRRPGAYLVLRMETRDADGRPVSTTEYGSLYRGVDCEAPSPGTPSEPASAGGPEAGAPWSWSAEVAVPAALAHVYTECARIWNPIHTDRAVARAAGLPDIILHGTATLALAVSQVLGRRPEGPATRVAAVECRFGAMVRLPSRLLVRGREAEPSPAGAAIAFEALAEDGRAALRDGRLELAPPSPLREEGRVRGGP